MNIIIKIEGHPGIIPTSRTGMLLALQCGIVKYDMGLQDFVSDCSAEEVIEFFDKTGSSWLMAA